MKVRFSRVLVALLHFRAIAKELNTFWRKNDKYKPSTQRNCQYFCQRDDQQKIVSEHLGLCENATIQLCELAAGHTDGELSEDKWEKCDALSRH